MICDKNSSLICFCFLRGAKKTLLLVQKSFWPIIKFSCPTLASKNIEAGLELAWVPTVPRVPGTCEVFWTVMSGTCWFWQFYYIMLYCTLEFEDLLVIGIWHPLLQILNSSSEKWQVFVTNHVTYFCGRLIELDYFCNFISW